jgi:peptidoglycan hydrolase CwlO-like protein
MIHAADGKIKDSLTTARNTEVKIERLEELISKLQSYLKEKQGDISPEKLLQLRNSNSINTRACASLLVDALITLDRL